MSSVAEPSYKSRTSYHAGMLGGLCALVSILLLLGNIETADVIKQRQLEDTLAMLDEVIDPKLYDNDLLTSTQTLTSALSSPETIEVYVGSKDGALSAVAFEQSVAGWGGTIRFIMAVSAGGEVLGVRVVGHSETPGLADKIEASKSDWIKSFDGRSLANTPTADWAVKKDQGVFDQFTGATITPRAMVRAVHQGLKFFAAHKDRELGLRQAVNPAPHHSGDGDQS